MALVGNLVVRIMSDSSAFRAGIESTIRDTNHLSRSVSNMTRGVTAWSSAVGTISPGLQSQVPILGAINTGLITAMNTTNIIRASQSAILVVTQAWRSAVVICGVAYRGVVAWITGSAAAQAALTASTITWATITGVGIPLVVAGLAAGAMYMASMSDKTNEATSSMKELVSGTKEYYEILRNGANNITNSLLTPLEKFQQKQKELNEMQTRANEAPQMIQNLQQNIAARQKQMVEEVLHNGVRADMGLVRSLEDMNKRDKEALKAIQDFVAAMPDQEHMQAEFARAHQEYTKSFGIDQIDTAQEVRDAAIKNLNAVMKAGVVSQEQYTRNLDKINETFLKNDPATQAKIASEERYANTLLRYADMVATPAEVFQRAMNEFKSFVESGKGVSDAMKKSVESKLQEQFASSLGLSEVLKAMQPAVDEYTQRLHALAHYAEVTGQSQEWLVKAQNALRGVMDKKAKQEAAASLRNANAAALRGSAAAYRISYESQHGNKQVEASKRIESEQKRGNALAKEGNGLLSNIVTKLAGGVATNFQVYTG